MQTQLLIKAQGAHQVCLLFMDQYFFRLCSESSLGTEGQGVSLRNGHSLQNQDFHLRQGICFGSLAFPGAAATFCPQTRRLHLCLNPDLRCIVPVDGCIWTL